MKYRWVRIPHQLLNMRKRDLMNSFFISILVFLLTIFPGCGFLQSAYQSATFPGVQVVMDNIVTAVEARNVKVLEDMMCPYIKKSIPKLSDEIDKLFTAIDGEIIESNWHSTSAYDSSINGQTSRKSFAIECKTASIVYLISLTWVVVNTNAPEEVGLRSFTLMDSENNVLSSIYVPSEYF
jgi:hypothetical protein